MDPSPPAPARAPTPSSNHSIPTPPQRTNSQSSINKSAHLASHRQSFVEGLRNPPPSPRAQRHPSFTQAAIQELLNYPPGNVHPNPRFAGRDWRDVTISELVSSDEVKWVDMDTSVEEATMTLLKSAPRGLVLIRENASAPRMAVSTFDYNDLNAYLLVVVGLARPEDDESATLYDDIQKKAQDRLAIPLRHIQPICRKQTLVTLPFDRDLADAIEVFGSGIHRILVTNHVGDVTAVLSQLRLLEFFWNEGINFPGIEKLYPVLLRDLGVATQQIIAINAESPLADALTLMNNEGLTSIAVVDNGANVVGNISTADVRHLTSAASLPLLQSSCMQFIAVILTERGVEKGRDSFPVFYVSPYSTLAHTVAKLVATRAHRMWVVESASPSPSQPATPLSTPAVPATLPPTLPPPSSASFSSLSPSSSTVLVPNPATAPAPIPLQGSAPPSPGFPNATPAAMPPASSLPGACVSGRLTGVISLTDILNLFARSSGLNPSDPGEQRARRRRSSSSSVRPSLDGSRGSIDFRR